ncbi:MAG: hypothetical protein ACLP5H_28145 [Desulfomonilaceae bacterium]
MNRKTILLSAAVILLVFSGLEYYLQAQSSEFPLGVTGESRYGRIDLLQGGFDRETCERDCREQYGVSFGPRDDPRARLYARCIQECERQFWKDFDSRTRDLEREK